MAPKTFEEIEALKASWLKDPCWDIEKTDGFEAHKEELIAFRNVQEAKWQSEIEEKREQRRRTFKMATGIDDPDLAEALSTFGEIEHTVKQQDQWIGECGNFEDVIDLTLKQEQIRATLLLTAQLKRLNDSLDGIIT